ncbi:hypothetical protein SAMN05518854_106154 [Variovorax sp. YR266]|uniref:hypothetical protein n=1 Tax=Variovorax sp. YR266 TaxID=1884386 RepID=UPI000899D68F|nr:hypothetical protein [Variovorax sp. YR266]SDZ44697.1 hypothetical protein SAMN05518854_106154 [Variovorax sp. YR266]
MPTFKHSLTAGLALAFALGATAEPVLLVTSPAALQAAEKSGASFAHWTGEAPGSDGIATNQALMRSPAWRSIAEPISASLSSLQRRDRQAGVGISKYPHRLFDARWLASPDAFFELVGVANRMDRRPFQSGACGETRLVYRLAYRTVAMQSRLPMTVNVELRGDAPDADGSCASTAKRWQPPQASMTDEATGRWLVSADGPLAPQRLALARIAQVTTNLQSVRWPSGVRPDLGGHAEYMLRAFRWNAGAKRFDVAPLENTPDIAKLKASAPLRKELQQWLQQPANLRALDEATLQIPEKFLATEAVSVAPRGLERLANRPFEQLFAPGEWQAVQGSRTLQSPQAVLRRLDDLSCAGCHQSRAVAGFHLLGVDRRGASRTFTTGNALAVPHSPHVQDELARRGTYVRAALSTPRPDPFRPLAEPDDANAVAEKPTVGARCEPTRITASANPWLDRAEKLPRISCEGMLSVCEKTSVGFPGGMCSGPCDPGDKNGTCGGIAILSDFNSCLAAKKPFGECLAKHTRPGNLRSCSAQQPCRDDYICAQAEGQPEGRGACIPPYFLFQMRVDGHS